MRVWTLPASVYYSSISARVREQTNVLRSLRFHFPRLCRAAVFLIQTNVSLSQRTNQRLSPNVSHQALHMSVLSSQTNVSLSL